MKNRQFTFGILFLTLFICSCKQKPNTQVSSTKDTILKSFFNIVDTLPYYDTTNLDYKFLKAYKENDTLNLKSITEYMQARSVKPWMNRYLKPMAVNKEFDTLKADEAYRFVYESSFCPYFTVASIIQRGKKITVKAIVYENASALNPNPCTIAQQNEISIDSISWVKFQDAILNADFWGLKEDNGYHGCDGNSLDVLGYQKSTEYEGGAKRSYVTRWVKIDRLVEPFMMLLRFCHINKGCLRPS